MPKFSVEINCVVIIEAEDAGQAAFLAEWPSEWECDPFDVSVLDVYPIEEEE